MCTESSRQILSPESHFPLASDRDFSGAKPLIRGTEVTRW
jgi:hypothetical protein